MSRPKVYNIPPWFYDTDFDFLFHRVDGIEYRRIKIRFDIRRIKEDGRDSPGKRFRRDQFPRCERFSQEGRSASVVRFSDRRRSISRQIEFFRRSKNAVYNRYGVEGNIRPLGL